jgi:hypothetical protein
VVGQTVSAGLSFTAMRLVGLSHIRDCRRVVEAIRADRGEPDRPGS